VAAQCLGRPPGGEAQLRELLQLIPAATLQRRMGGEIQHRHEDAAARAAQNATFKVCSRSFPALMEAPWMFEIVVLPEETLLIFENGQVRHLYTDGRAHPSSNDLCRRL